MSRQGSFLTKGNRRLRRHIPKKGGLLFTDVEKCNWPDIDIAVVGTGKELRGGERERIRKVVVVLMK